MARISPSPRGGEGRGEVLPILMYHSVSERDESHLRDYFKVCTSPARFREQMRTLRENGFTGVDLQTGLDWLNRKNEVASVSGLAPTRNGVSLWAKGESGLGGELGSRRHEEADLPLPEGPGTTESSGVGEVPSSHSALRVPHSALGEANPLLPLRAGDLSRLESNERNSPRAKAHCGPRERERPSHWAGVRCPLPTARPVVITFDDGFQDFFTEAVPVLQEHGFTATMYLPTAFIGDTRRTFSPRHHSSRSTLNSNPSTAPACLTWSEVYEARRAGMTFGSHTVNHPKLHGMPWSDIESELRDSRRTLEDHLGEAVPDFAYPYAFPEADREFCKRFRETVEAAGYSTNVTTLIGRLGPGDDPYTLRRLPMNGADDGKLLLAKLAGAYDWVASVQKSSKMLRR